MENKINIENENLNGLKVKGNYCGEPGVFTLFKRDMFGKINCNFTRDKLTASGMPSFSRVYIHEEWVDLVEIIKRKKR